MGQVHRQRAGTGPGQIEQLGLFGQLGLFEQPGLFKQPGPPSAEVTVEVPAEPPVEVPAQGAAPGLGPAGRESNDMALVVAVLAAAGRYGYFLTGDGTCWRAGTETDAGTGDVALVEPEPGEAAMVAQLLARGWLLRAGRTRRRAGTLRGRSSGRRRVGLDVHPLTVAAAARAAASRWSALAAVPAQRRPRASESGNRS